MFDQLPDDTCVITGRLFENAEWRVLGDGLEHRATGYFIARDTFAMRRGDLWEWPLHLAEKSWCSLRSFREAFVAAVEAFGLTPDADLSRSFVAGFGRVASPGLKARTDEFVALGEIVRPKTGQPAPARKRAGAGEPRPAARHAGMRAPQRANDVTRQRVTL
ncbi:hypothetical protein [Methylobacterium sp. J-068]|uniref:hypothetical protein n=1 Tax=Methylobacterium sp. J-068 TaxID=2836649 RepID=UPI001FB9C2A7|nr:hypothetical protein [Methylobacterium sp. J-068]MCJ2037138.1 hypothetical protein [Methylobacterium sp. J-068]